MDLSAIIFVVLAVAWAVYLIPKALKHHDEMASDRLVEGHSERVRILSRHKTSVTVETVDEDVAEPVVDNIAVPPSVESVEPRSAKRPSRASARRAARNRRRVLSVLVLATAVVAVLAGFAIVPWWSVAIRPENTSSLRVVEKLGIEEVGYAPRFLHIDGDWRDHRLFAITSEEVPMGLLKRLEASESQQSHE